MISSVGHMIARTLNVFQKHLFHYARRRRSDFCFSHVLNLSDGAKMYFKNIKRSICESWKAAVNCSFGSKCPCLLHLHRKTCAEGAQLFAKLCAKSLKNLILERCQIGNIPLLDIFFRETEAA